MCSRCGGAREEFSARIFLFENRRDVVMFPRTSYKSRSTVCTAQLADDQSEFEEGHE